MQVGHLQEGVELVKARTGPPNLPRLRTLSSYYGVISNVWLLLDMFWER